MTDHEGVSEILEIDFEVGHTSTIRTEPTTEHDPPRTHDWKLFLRSTDINADLNCLIHHCIFHLHPDFGDFIRELRTTPFAIKETGYAGFHLLIDIYFHTKNEPKKFRIEYDLDLHTNANGQPFRQKESFRKRYRCTFHDPDPEFRKRILDAGGKLVDTGPSRSSHSDINEKDASEEKTTRPSPQQKRPASPISLADGVTHKKVKLDPTIKKKQAPPTIVKTENTTKTIVNKKQPKLVPCKSSSLLEDKTAKNVPVKESNPSINSNNTTIENSLAMKPRPTTKLVKSQSTNDIKSSAVAMTKKKEFNHSPFKTKINLNPQVVLKRAINKIPGKTSIKPESTFTSSVKSPSNSSIKQELPPPSTTTNTSAASINNLKKIPKKPLATRVEGKRSQSLMPPATSDRKSTTSKDKQKPQESSTTKPKVKRDSSIPSTKVTSNNNNNERLSKIKTVKTVDQSNPIRNSQSKVPKSSRSPSQSRSEHPANNIPPPVSTETSRPSIPTPPSTQPSQNEDNHIQTPMDIDRHNNDDHLQLSDDSNSPEEPLVAEAIEIPITRMPYFDQSDMRDSDRSPEDDYDDDEDLPASLTDDDLRYKLIYIYQRFQLNSTKDLIIFVRFFKRHHLIDISSLSMTKSSNDMFTYDLLTLSPSHIGELANDLGYSTVKTKNSLE